MRRLFFLLIGILISSQVTFAQKAKYHGDIIYRLSKHISWSEYSKGYKFILGVVGNSHDYQYFQSFASSKSTINDHLVEVRYYACTDNIDECDLIYLSEDCSIDIDQVIKKTSNEPILIVTGKDGYGKSGSIINFVDVDGKLRFELNQGEARQRGLKVSDELKRLAILI